MPPTLRRGNRRVYDLGTLDADALLRVLRGLAPDWYEHVELPHAGLIRLRCRGWSAAVVDGKGRGASRAQRRLR